MSSHALSRPWMPLLLCTALGLTACDSLKSAPDAPDAPAELPPELGVTVRATGPAFCGEGSTWTLTVAVSGGTPKKVELVTNGSSVTTLASPYVHTVNCATHAEGGFTFVARATAGGRSFDSPSASVVVDRQQPRVASWRPGHSLPTADTPVEIVFSEPLLPESLQASPTVLRDGDGIPVEHQAVLSEDGKVLRLVPTAPLRPPVTLHAELSQRDMTDRAGNLLEWDLSSFERELSYWPFARAVPSMSETPTVASCCAFALQASPREVPFVAFIEEGGRDGIDEPGVARWNGEAWERLPAPREPEARTRKALNPQLMSSPEGNLVLAWGEQDDLFGLMDIHVMRYDGTSWTRLGEPQDTGSSSSARFRMALAPDGHPVLVYQMRFEQELGVVRWNGTAWESLGYLLTANPEGNTLAAFPAIAVDASRVVVAWSEKPVDQALPHVFVMEFRDGRGSPLGRPLLATEGGNATDVAIALDGVAGPAVAWTERLSSGGSLIFVSRWKDDGLSYNDWGPPEQVHEETPFYGPSNVRLVMDANHEPWVAWERWGSTPPLNRESVFRRYRATEWEPLQLIAGSSLHEFWLDAHGVPWAAVESGSDATLVRPQ
ncbi:Ig-like domain-containing protein [Pyxidicoccus sp. MSG2]|uniref:Ig-like domain-containing protein n=1 Tax=Pyxidicoccus sp. MSG2 TaxID=2996790 RepID=UPI00226DAD26|nr:Ig-like domain-containing protein [Pyxidicoccus sp. MSG2]MCY1021618.1 Ig-like domain-containing protein [Pyxidicoccus sp. MSG2]